MRAELGDLLRPRLERLSGRVAAGDSPQSSVPLRDSGTVFDRQPGAGGDEPPQRAIEVRTSRRGPALDHDEPVRREDECGDLRAQLLGRAYRRPVQAGALALPRLQRHLELDRHTAAHSAERNPARLLPEADQLRIGARARREALRADVQRLEQVRLAGPVPPHHEHESRLEAEVELLVRAEVPERDRADDQRLTCEADCRGIACGADFRTSGLCPFVRLN
jgi:hypothetical protein